MKLGVWLGRQRQAKKGKGTCKISLEQIHRLEEIGVWWDKPDTWEEYFAALESTRMAKVKVTQTVPKNMSSNGYNAAIEY